MHFPKWARESAHTRLRYLCLTLATDAGPKGLSSLARKAGVTEATIQNGLNRGKFPLKTALALSHGNDSGVPFHWLMAPERIEINDEGFAYDQD